MNNSYTAFVTLVGSASVPSNCLILRFQNVLTLRVTRLGIIASIRNPQSKVVLTPSRTLTSNGVLTLGS